MSSIPTIELSSYDLGDVTEATIIAHCLNARG